MIKLKIRMKERTNERIRRTKTERTRKEKTKIEKTRQTRRIRRTRRTKNGTERPKGMETKQKTAHQVQRRRKGDTTPPKILNQKVRSNPHDSPLLENHKHKKDKARRSSMGTNTGAKGGVSVDTDAIPAKKKKKERRRTIGTLEPLTSDMTEAEFLKYEKRSKEKGKEKLVL